MNYFKLSLVMFFLCTLLGCQQSSKSKNVSTIADSITLEKNVTHDVTYTDYGNNDGESALSLEQTLKLFDTMTWNKDAFISFPVSSKNLCQITYEGENRFLIEITNDSEDMIFNQKYASREECKEIITAMFERDVLDAKFMSSFYKVPIKTKTLDDVMKQEKNANR